MNEKRATTILLLIFASVFVYSVFMRDTVAGSGAVVQEYISPANRQPSYYPASSTPTSIVAQPAPPTPVLPLKRVFVWSIAYSTGGLGGYNGAVAKCQFAATNASLSGRWVPWLSVWPASPLYPNITAKDQIPDAKYIRLDGKVVAMNKADLLDGTLLNPINVDENKQKVTSDLLAWTGTSSSGHQTLADCKGWNVGIMNLFGTTGFVNAINYSWTAGSSSGLSASCGNLPHRLYCFEK
jgi:hypothetical protein